MSVAKSKIVQGCQESWNLVIFGDRLAPGALEVIEDHGLIDWQAWQRANKVAF